MKTKARVIALYLPQFQPIDVNNRFWGKGFTEWTNVAKAKPLFHNHQQPRIPADLGFYDLRFPIIREEQAKMAREAGVEGFCYWHYWFGNGKEVLEKTFDEVVETKVPDFPFCLGWALHDWTTNTWEKGKIMQKNSLIFKQEFPGYDDNVKHFYRLLDAFKDKRYIKVDGKLLFVILVPQMMPDPTSFIKTWNELSKKNGLPGFYFVASIESVPELTFDQVGKFDELILNNIQKYKKLGFDGVETINGRYAEFMVNGKFKKMIKALMRKIAPGLFIDKMDYSKIIDSYYTKFDRLEYVYPQVLVGWDRSPRAGRKAVIYYNDTPKAFGKAVDKALEVVKDKSPEHRILFLNSWNEWGEGAYMEPDLRYGRKKLDVLKEKIFYNE